MKNQWGQTPLIFSPIDFFKKYEAAGVLVACVGRVLTAFDLMPGVFVERREPRVTLDVGLYPGQVDAPGAGQEQFVQRRPAHDHDLVSPGTGCEGLFRVVADVAALAPCSPVAG